MIQLQFPIKKFITKDVLTVNDEITFAELLQEFKKTDKSFAIILKGKKPVGIITERDVLKAKVDRYPLNNPIKALIKKELIKVEENEIILQAFQLMTENFIRRLIVVDKEGNFVGVFTQEDFVRYSEAEIFRGEGKIRDLLEDRGQEFYYLTPSATLNEAIQKMALYNIGCLPILDEDLHPIGIITEKDVLRFSEEDLKRSVQDLGKKKVVTIKISEPILKAVNYFREKKIRHLVVVDAEDRAVNVISQRDLVSNLSTTYTQFLENSLQQFKNFINLMPELVIELTECDHTCKISWLNEFAKKFFGEDCLEKDISYLFLNEEWDRIYGHLLKNNYVYKEKIRGTEGKIYEISATYLKLGQKTAKIKIFLKDITKSIEEGENLKREIRFLKSFLDNSLDLILVIDPQGSLIFANDSFKRFLGYSEEEVKNLKIWDVVNLSFEDIKKNIDLLLWKDEIIVGERLYKDKFGNFYPVEIKARALIVNGQRLIVINAREITKYKEELKIWQDRYRTLEDLSHFVERLSTLSKPEDVFQALESFFLTKVETFHFYEFDPEERIILSTYVAGQKSSWEDCLEREVEECKVFKTGKVVLGNEELSCPRFKQKGAFLCIPYFFEGKIRGIITLFREKPLPPEEAQIFREIVNIFSAYFHLVKLQRELKELSIRDPLLKVFNRRFMDELLKKEIKKMEREGGTFSLLLSDLDDFKKINDTYGHDVGDEVLKYFVNLVKTLIREMDVLGRWGGEEFLIYLPSANKEQAKRVAERIIKRLNQSPIYINDKIKIQLTSSFGLATYPEDALTVDGLIKVADNRLYKAKLRGKNCVVSE